MPSHPLPASWDLYAHTLAPGSAYQNAYTRLITLDTCEAWAATWNHVPGADTLATHSKVVKMKRGARVVGYSLFRLGVKPEWEDPANHLGKTLSVRTPSMRPDAAQKVWTALVVECVRGAADDGLVGVQCFQKRSGRDAPVVVLKFDLWLCAHADAERIARHARTLTGLRFEVTPRRTTT